MEAIVSCKTLVYICKITWSLMLQMAIVLNKFAEFYNRYSK